MEWINEKKEYFKEFWIMIKVNNDNDKSLCNRFSL